MTDNRLLLAFILLLGCAIRMIHLVFVGLHRPFGSAGLYMEFAHQIITHNYALPDWIPFYTDGGIPFAYPPIPFYVAAVLLDIFSIPEIAVANLLPACIAILTLPSFYILIRELDISPWAQVVAMLAFATMPTAFQEQIATQGLAEGFGTLSLIWLAITLVRCYKHDTVVSYVGAGLLWAISILASPGSAYASVPTIIILVIARFSMSNWRLSLRTVGLFLMTALITFILTSPYWGTVINNHGIQVFTTSFSAQHNGWFIPIEDLVKRVLYFRISKTQFPTVWDMFIFLGVISALSDRRYALLAWLIALLYIPRESGWLVSVPAAILAGLGATEIFGPIVVKLIHTYPSRIGRAAIASGFILYLSLYVISNPIMTLKNMGGFEVNPIHFVEDEKIIATSWIRDNIPTEAKFILIGPFLEWTPHLMRRTVLNIPFGAEWEPEELDKIRELNQRLEECTDFNCIQQSIKTTTGYDETYLLLDNKRRKELACASEGSKTTLKVIWHNDKATVGYLLVGEGNHPTSQQ